MPAKHSDKDLALAPAVLNMLEAMAKVVKKLPEEEAAKFKENPHLYIASYFVSLAQAEIDDILETIAPELENTPPGIDHDKGVAIANALTQHSLELMSVADLLEKILTDTYQE